VRWLVVMSLTLPGSAGVLAGSGGEWWGRWPAPGDYDDGGANGPRPAATATAGAAAMPGCVNGGTPHRRRWPGR